MALGKRFWVGLLLVGLGIVILLGNLGLLWTGYLMWPAILTILALFFWIKWLGAIRTKTTLLIPAVIFSVLSAHSISSHFWPGLHYSLGLAMLLALSAAFYLLSYLSAKRQSYRIMAAFLALLALIELGAGLIWKLLIPGIFLYFGLKLLRSQSPNRPLGQDENHELPLESANHATVSENELTPPKSKARATKHAVKKTTT